MVSTTAAASRDTYRGTDKLLFGIVLAVITFWLFAQTTLNVAPAALVVLRLQTIVSRETKPGDLRC